MTLGKPKRRWRVRGEWALRMGRARGRTVLPNILAVLFPVVKWYEFDATAIVSRSIAKPQKQRN
jgi:muconolactone delta-isomerase